MKINYVCRMAKNRAVALGLITAMICWASYVPAWAEKISLTESAHRSSIKIKAGDVLEITLAGNPTTGYIWERVAGDDKILSQQGDYNYIPASSLIGSGGKFVFSFQVTDVGKTKLKLIYHRTFEKKVAPVKTWEVMVIVN